MRPVIFVKYFDKGSTVMGGEQISAGLQARGMESRTVYATELSGVRNSIVVFIKKGRLRHILGAKMGRNRTVLDAQDTPVFKRWIRNRTLYDALIFKNRRQLEDFGRPGAPDRVIYHQWDPRYERHRVPAGELRPGYLGLARSIDFWEQLPGVAFIDQDYFRRALEVNCHLSIRRPGREMSYKPGTKVSTAAACGAVLITSPSESAREMLGADYPYFTGPSHQEIEASLAKVREGFGGAEWQEALARIEELRVRTKLERILDDYEALFGDLEPST